MRISYNWLQEYIKVKEPAEKVAELFTMAGLSVASIEKVGSDTVIEIEITSNRPDWLSVVGVARELAAITGGEVVLPDTGKRPSAPDTGDKVKISVEDKKLCARYTARVIRGVSIKESPEWLRERIISAGQRPINNVVDITNFCLFETGEPLHAFDLDKLRGQEIRVRRARKGEKIVTIDGVERALDETMLVIADSERPVAIAGVMGGANTEVTAATKNILLEAASFDQISVRRTARKLALSTEASYRFERKVDLQSIPYSSERATGLVLALAGGNEGGSNDVGEKARAKRTVELKVAHIARTIGIEVPLSQVKKILTALGFALAAATKEKIKIEVPSFRNDIESEIDIIEEIIRIYGYDKVPCTLPAVSEQPVRESAEAVIRKKIRQTLMSIGFDEIMTYSLTSKKCLIPAGAVGDDTVTVQNPLSSEQEVMRPSLLPGALQAAGWNINRKAHDLKLFELGSVYRTEGLASFSEEPTLSLCLSGLRAPEKFGASDPCDFFDLKGAVETLFEELGVGRVSFRDLGDDRFVPGLRAAVVAGEKTVGVIGEVTPALLKSFDIKEKIYAAEISVGALAGHAKLEKHFHELPKFPPVSRDLSILIDKKVTNEAIVSAIKGSGGELLTEAKLIDMYSGEQIPSGKVSLTYRLEYRDANRTLEDKDILSVHSHVIKTLEDSLGAKHR